MAKLSATQQDLLETIQRGVVVHYMPYAGKFNPAPYYFRSDNLKRCTAAADALIKKGIVELRGEWNRKKLVLKEAS